MVLQAPFPPALSVSMSPDGDLHQPVHCYWWLQTGCRGYSTCFGRILTPLRLHLGSLGSPLMHLPYQKRCCLRDRQPAGVERTERPDQLSILEPRCSSATSMTSAWSAVASGRSAARFGSLSLTRAATGSSMLQKFLLDPKISDRFPLSVPLSRYACSSADCSSALLALPQSCCSAGRGLNCSAVLSGLALHQPW